MDEDINATNAAHQPFMGVMRELARAYQAFTAFDSAGYRDTGLTSPQADVIFTLGNTRGMTCKEIGEHTLITKGTLTGVIDRLEQKDLVRRVTYPGDRRCTRVVLTDGGEHLFAWLFPRQIRRMKARFDRLTPHELHETEAVLRRLREAFS